MATQQGRLSYRKTSEGIISVVWFFRQGIAFALDHFMIKKAGTDLADRYRLVDR